MLIVEAKTLPYSAVLGIDSLWGCWQKGLLYKALGFFDFKIKLSGNQAKDLRVLKLIPSFRKESDSMRIIYFQQRTRLSTISCRSGFYLGN